MVYGSAEEFIIQVKPFLGYLIGWVNSLSSISFSELVKDGSDKVAIVCVDMVEGFCRSGVLASDRIGAIIPNVVNLFKRAYSAGVRHFALTQDYHSEDAPEFSDFPPHCVAGTEEAETIKEIKELPFFESIDVIRKKTISSSIDTSLEKWLTSKDLKHIVIVGDCTDLCTYQLAMFVKLLSNARNYGWNVILPLDCVETYDMPVDLAKKIGAKPHPGDLFHILFAYHMALNGVKVVKSIH